MNILMAAGEMAPLVRSGELADAVAELAGELQRLGHAVTVVLPYYRCIRETKGLRAKRTGTRLNVPVGAARYTGELFETKLSSGARVVLVARDEFFDRSGIYGTEGNDYQDNAARFIFLTKCAVEYARRMDPAPDILHLHSWETALAPVFVRDQRLPVHTVLTPHSLAFQGNFWSYDFALTNLPGEYFSTRGLEFYGSMNCLKAGILFADAVVLPGERFIHEALTPTCGCGLENVLLEHRHKLTGIDSAAGLETWTPENDSALAARFSAGNPSARNANRKSFLAELALDATPGPLVVTLADSLLGPGIDTLLAAIDRLVADGTQLALIGPVDPSLRVPLETARRRHVGRFVHTPATDDALCRRALAAADLFLLPGAVEPHTVWLRRALRYGAVPVALHCGGLFQLVRDIDPPRGGGNGFVFFAPTVDGLVDIVRRAGRTMRDPETAAILRERCMAYDFSPVATAKAHAALYERLTGGSAAARAA